MNCSGCSLALCSMFDWAEKPSVDVWVAQEEAPPPYSLQISGPSSYLDWPMMDWPGGAVEAHLPTLRTKKKVRNDKVENLSTIDSSAWKVPNRGLETRDLLH